MKLRFREEEVIVFILPNGKTIATGRTMGLAMKWTPTDEVIGHTAMEITDAEIPDVQALLDIDEANIVQGKRAREQTRGPTFIPPTATKKRAKLKRFGWKDNEIDVLVREGVITL